jgi:lipopolysaccharide assembly protein A
LTAQLDPAPTFEHYNASTTGGQCVKYLSWLLKAALFFVVFAFALNNLDDVLVHFFFGNTWQAPLVLVVLAALIIGVVLGALLIMPLWLKARQALKAQQQAPAPAETAQDSTPQPPYGI